MGNSIRGFSIYYKKFSWYNGNSKSFGVRKMIQLQPKEKEILKNLKFVDLFAGIGAFRLALESFGAQCVFSCEIDRYSQEVYFRNYGEKPIADITRVKEEEIPTHDILCAGFPCQPFSISGKKLGFQDTRGTLFFEVARIVQYHKPKVIIMENVKNIMSHDKERTVKVIQNTLQELGYDVYIKILNASDYGVPQKRERAFFVCFRKDLEIKEYQFPDKVELRKHLIDYVMLQEDVSSCMVHRTDISWREDVVEDYSNRPIRIGSVDKGRQGERIYSPFGVAITLSATGGGVGAKTGLYRIQNQVRRLTPRECARLMGFPDTFSIANRPNIAYKQFGNSIVVDVIQYIVKSIIEVI